MTHIFFLSFILKHFKEENNRVMRYLEARLTFLLNDLLSVLSQKPVDNSDYFVFVNLLLLFSPAPIFTFFFSILNFLYLLH